MAETIVLVVALVVIALIVIGVIVVGIPVLFIAGWILKIYWWVVIPILGAALGGWIGFFFAVGLVVISFGVYEAIKGE